MTTPKDLKAALDCLATFHRERDDFVTRCEGQQSGTAVYITADTEAAFEIEKAILAVARRRGLTSRWQNGGSTTG